MKPNRKPHRATGNPMGRPPTQSYAALCARYEAEPIDRDGNLSYAAVAKILTDRGYPTTEKSAKTLHWSAIRKLRHAMEQMGI